MNNFIIEHCDELKFTKDIINFVKEHHYSNSCRSLMQKHIFKLMINDNIVGIAIYGLPVGKKCQEKYGKGTIELRRFCLIDNLPKNTASFFLGRTIKYLKNNTDWNKIITYADPNVGHSGTIYKATNFEFLGKSNASNPRMIIGPKKNYSLRELYQKRDGQYVRSALEIQNMIKTGKAKIVDIERKLVYMYNLRSLDV